MNKSFRRALAGVATAPLAALSVVALDATASAVEDGQTPTISRSEGYSQGDPFDQGDPYDQSNQSETGVLPGNDIVTTSQAPTATVTAPTYTPAATLAETGTEAWQLGAAIALVLAGSGLIRAARRSRQPA